MLYDGIAPVAHGALLTFIFPMTYVVGFLTVLPLQKDKNSFYKVFLFGLLIGALILFVIYIGVILVLGPYNAASFYYPSYIKVSMINIGNFLQRLDILTAVVYVCGIFIQTCVFLMGACKGFAKLFAFSDYRFIVWPIAILAITLAHYEPGSVMHYFEYGTQVWPYYILLYETVFPFLVWVVAEIKVRIAKKRRAVPES
ncbi:hypothetical protein SDC9_168261 [bioreactor metagenome]|uniref:Spore germination protein YndE n=1 Tax=bioreactor metagenome TaxID=1076179 RepID=A0A645G4K0_9ZZZZ